MPVNTPRADYVDMLPKWQRCADCYEGGDAVKARGPKYLPLLDSHKTVPRVDTDGGDARYQEYKLRALFYNATGRTVDGLGGAIFQKTPTIKLPALVEDDAKDITLTGETAELFALKTTREVLGVGRIGILVEMASKESPEQRPYWVSYEAQDIVNWRTERIGGDQVLTRVVLREVCEESDAQDQFKINAVEQYRVLELLDGRYTQTTWRQNERKEWAAAAPVVPQRRGAALNFIPFVFIGPTSVSPDIEKPPLLDLVDVNLSHYRTMADLEHGRHFCALPTPWVTGMLDNNSGDLSIGSGTAWVLGDNGSAGMLEFTGQGLGALEKADEQKRRMMATLGARLLEEQATSAETATAVGMRHSGEHATLRTVAQAVEQGLTMALQIHAWWMGTEVKPEDVEAGIELNKDFWSVRMTADELRGQVLALQADAISYKTFYANITRGDMSRPGVDAEEEQAEIQRQVVERPAIEPGRQPDPNTPVFPPDEPPANVPPGAPKGAPPAPAPPPPSVKAA
jgi:hypothetical protein